MLRQTVALAVLSAGLCAQTFPFRITEVVADPAPGDDQVVEITNITASSENIQGFQLCSQFTYAAFPNLNLAAGGSVRVHVNATGANTGADIFLANLPMNAASDGLGLYRPGGGITFFGNPNNMVDFVQWGAGNQPRATVAVGAGIWPNAAAFTPVPAQGASLAWDGDGESPADYFRDSSPTLGAPNVTPTALVESLGDGCSDQTPPVLTSTSAPALGNQDFVVSLSSDQANSPTLLLIGLGSQNVPILGGQCSLYVTTAPISIELNLATNGAGNITLPLPILDEPTLEGVQISFQALIANASPTLKFDVSSGLGVTF